MRRFSCRDQFLSMVFAQLTYRESLGDIETCLRSLGGKLYHTGIRRSVALSTLAGAIEHRPVQTRQELHQDEQLVNDLTAAVSAFDATILELCPKLFPWAKAAHLG